MNLTRRVLAILTAMILVGLFAAPTLAYSGFPSVNYPGNQYGFQSTYYDGPWGERMVYGGYGYFPQQYGYRTYGHFYTPSDLRMGNAYNSYSYSYRNTYNYRNTYSNYGGYGYRNAYGYW